MSAAGIKQIGGLEGSNIITISIKSSPLFVKDRNVKTIIIEFLYHSYKILILVNQITSRISQSLKSIQYLRFPHREFNTEVS